MPTAKMAPTQLRRALRAYKAVADAARMYKAAEAAYRLNVRDFRASSAYQAADVSLRAALAAVDQMEGRR